MSPEDKLMADTDTMLKLEMDVKQRTKQHIMELLMYEPDFKARVVSMIMNEVKNNGWRY